ncbi:hypothetical protein HCH_05577 [Hahella chejuensis KCTC 2396]|uniref:Uncharacterized protein n=1 Tax=Hahella chejuensis (strain KCTC 2396) TaxID=349521 RepID=Q2SAT7_HAHCH|nr:hypothetical protein HCH_05577 [Hahella chejuensis KCTC 2396]
MVKVYLMAENLAMGAIARTLAIAFKFAPTTNAPDNEPDSVQA